MSDSHRAKAYGFFSLASLGGAAALIANLIEPYMNTDPFWDTGSGSVESIALPVAGVFLCIGGLLSAFAVAYGSSDKAVREKQKQTDNQLIPIFFIAGFFALTFSAFTAFDNTFDAAVLDDNSTAVIRGARALEGFVGAVSVILAVLSFAKMRGWEGVSKLSITAFSSSPLLDNKKNSNNNGTSNSSNNSNIVPTRLTYEPRPF